jgi:uncharacterized protein (TIGR02600 family)
MKGPLPRQCASPALAPTYRSACGRSSVSGVALVIVLVMLALVAILLIAFLSNAATELRSAKSYAVGLDVRALADSAVNVVISQIQDATTAPTNAWASQPGMIRTYDTNGVPVTAYKLYSADQLRITGAFNANAGPGSDPTSQSTDVPSNWSTLPDQYTDLNKPVVVSGVSHYPIIDPGAVASGQAGTIAMDGTSTPIQGCYLDTANAATTTSATQTNPMPMPVKWLYILQDGTITTISSAGVISSATSGNPIVGRIAFWTDDETCKVNVNTSGEGTFWAPPYAESATTSSGYERGFLANSIPAQNEFQRYPGHPAMTSLSVIFPPIAGESTHDYNERVYGIIPRLATGGSQSGTVATSTTTPIPVPNASRLFGSIDEFLFSAATTTPRTANLKGPSTSFADSDIEKTRFFLTANSRAPEVNMFNKPRITLWPLQANTANVSAPTGSTSRTAKDALIAFCSTIGNTPYYFQRYSTFDTTQAVTQGSPVPSSQSPSVDWTSIPRNQSLFAYLQYLTSNAIPGLGGKLSGTGGKYATSVRDQILTEMMDFIRSDITSATTGGTPTYFYAPGISTGSVITGERQIVPLSVTPSGASYTTRGFGRFETIQQAALVFYRMDVPSVKNPGTASHQVIQTPPPGGIASGTPANIGVVLLLNPFCPSPGSRPWSENVRYVVSGLSGCKINNAALTNPFPDPGILLLNAKENIDNATALFGPEFFFQYNGGYKTLGPTTSLVGSSTEAQFYPFYGSATVTVAPGQAASPANNGQFQFTPPPNGITISVYPGYDPGVTSTSLATETPVQTINMTFSPGAAVRLPLPTATYSLGTSPYSETINPYTNYNSRIGNGNIGIDNLNPWGHNPSPFIVGDNTGNSAGADGDIVRSIEARYKGPAMGDLRVFAALPNVPSDYFEAHGMVDTSPADGLHYSDTAATSALIHSIRMYSTPGNTMTGKSDGAYNGSGGPLGTLIWDSGSTTVANYFLQNTSGGSNKQSLYPIVPRGLTPTQAQLTGLDGNPHPGDWDTGPGDQPDGPYINKCDEGNAADPAYSGLYTIGSSENGGNIVLDEQGTTYSPNRQIFSAVAFGSLPTGIDPASPDTAGAAPAVGSQSLGGIRPWQTLLFCANPPAGLQHPGMGTPTSTSSSYTANNAPQPPPYSVPPDSAFLDFFTMPIVEPYAVSEPFSTAGKINMNYQIVPFTYLTRDTAVRAVLKADRMMAIPQTDKGNSSSLAAVYKVQAAQAGTAGTPDYRYTINPDEITGTLAGFQQRFATGDIFRSAAEICGIYLVPQNKVTATTAGAGESLSTAAAGSPTYNTMNSWWSNYTLTGDNLREFPYGYIYARLTTKSNSYTVHVMTQTLKKAPNTSPTQFVDGADQVTSEYRGSYIVQRYLDPNSDSLVEADNKTPGSETDPNSMVGPYKFRVVATKRFAP